MTWHLWHSYRVVAVERFQTPDEFARKESGTRRIDWRWGLQPEAHNGDRRISVGIEYTACTVTGCPARSWRWLLEAEPKKPDWVDSAVLPPGVTRVGLSE